MHRSSAVRHAVLLVLAILGFGLIVWAVFFFNPRIPRTHSILAAALEITVDRPAADIARSYLDEPETRGRDTPNGQEIRARFRKESRDPHAPVNGLTALVSDPAPDVRRRSLCLLAALDDPTVVPMLIAALKDPEFSVRKVACEVLGWGRLPSNARPILCELVKSDPSVPVRVAAVLTLKSEDEDAVAAYRLGLENYWQRADCEDALARLGKLEWPLPDRIYWHSTASKYEEYLKDRKVKRENRKNGRIYFEVEELVCSGGPNHAMRLQRFWYRAEEQDK